MPFALGSTPMDNTTLRRALTQRNQATACAILSLVISLALIMNTFLSHRKDLVEAHQTVRYPQVTEPKKYAQSYQPSQRCQYRGEPLA